MQDRFLAKRLSTRSEGHTGHIRGGGLLALASIALVCSTGLPGVAAPQPDKPDKLYTVTYDVSDLIHRPGGKTGYDRIDDLIPVLMTALNPDLWAGAKEGGSSLHELNGTRLEAHTTAAEHAVIENVLAALRRQMDVAVEVKGELCEVERAFYDKEVRPQLGNGKAAPGKAFALPVDDALAELIRKRATLYKTGQARIANGRELPFFSLRRAVAPAKRPAGPPLQPTPGTVLYGVTVRASVVVSSDRTTVRMRITQQVTDFLGIKKQEVVDAATGKKTAVKIPDLMESSTAVRVEVGDGVCLLMPVLYQPPSAREKDRVLLLLVRPLICIEEEEKERRKNDS